MLAPAAYSLDALYSTGNAHALHTMSRLTRLFRGGQMPDSAALASYDAGALQREIAFLDRLVHGSYQAMRHFGLLSSFAALLLCRRIGGGATPSGRGGWGGGISVVAHSRVSRGTGARL